MIVKPSTKSDECAAMVALIAALDFDHLPERTRKNALARRRGLEGERATAHILDRHFHDAPNHALLHDLRLPDGIGGFAQVDHVILSRLSRTAAVLEVKNYRGRLSKNEHDEWLVWYEGRRRPIDIPNSLAQAHRQKEVLRAWLKANNHDMAFEKIGAFVIIPPDCSIDRSLEGQCRCTNLQGGQLHCCLDAIRRSNPLRAVVLDRRIGNDAAGHSKPACWRSSG